MTDDVRRYIYTTITVFLVGVGIWISFLFLNACGLSSACSRANPVVDRTPVPTLLPATLPVMQPALGAEVSGGEGRCRVVASKLIGFWVEAGSPKEGSFAFTDAEGHACISSYNEISNLLPNDQLIAAGSAAPIEAATPSQ